MKWQRSFGWLGLITIVLSAPWLSCVQQAEPTTPTSYKQGYVPYAVWEESRIWIDPTRLRPVSVRLYGPEGLAGPLPVIVFSPGLGGKLNQYTYLGRTWAGEGYLAVHLAHPDPDYSSVLAGQSFTSILTAVVSDSVSWLNRPRDVSFVIDQVEADPDFGPQVDPDRIAVAGHSLGAYTALAVVGMHVNLPGAPAVGFRDERVKAAVVMSPLTNNLLGLDDQSWQDIATPVLTMIGTLDYDPSTLDPHDRRRAFDLSGGPDQFLLTLRYGTHGGFDDHVFTRADSISFSRNHGYIEMTSTAFFDAYVKGDATAWQWLTGGEIERISGGECQLEMKNVATPIAQP